LSSTFYEFNSFFIFQFFISFAVGSGLLIREIDDGTLAFLDGLPLTRARAFTTKIVTATAVLLCYPLGHSVFISVLHLTARESLDYDLHLSLIAATIAPIVLITAVGLTCGLLLGFLRSLAWMVFALLAWGVFGGLLIGRAAFGWRGRTALRWTFIGFVMLLLAYVGSRFVLEVVLRRYG